MGDIWRALRAARLSTGMQALLAQKQANIYDAKVAPNPRGGANPHAWIWARGTVTPDAEDQEPTELEIAQSGNTELARQFRDDAENGALLEKVDRYETKLRRRLDYTEYSLDHTQDRRIDKGR